MELTEILSTEVQVAALETEITVSGVATKVTLDGVTTIFTTTISTSVDLVASATTVTIEPTAYTLTVPSDSRSSESEYSTTIVSTNEPHNIYRVDILTMTIGVLLRPYSNFRLLTCMHKCTLFVTLKTKREKN